MQKLLTQRDVAKMLGISSDRIREYTRACLLNHVSLPGLKKPSYTVECGSRSARRAVIASARKSGSARTRELSRSRGLLA